MADEQPVPLWDIRDVVGVIQRQPLSLGQQPAAFVEFAETDPFLHRVALIVDQRHIVIGAVKGASLHNTILSPVAADGEGKQRLDPGGIGLARGKLNAQTLRVRQEIAAQAPAVRNAQHSVLIKSGQRIAQPRSGLSDVLGGGHAAKQLVSRSSMR